MPPLSSAYALLIVGTCRIARALGCRILHGYVVSWLLFVPSAFLRSIRMTSGLVMAGALWHHPCLLGVYEECYLVDPASSHMLVSKIKPCMCKYELIQTVKLRMAH